MGKIMKSKNEIKESIKESIKVFLTEQDAKRAVERIRGELPHG